MYTGGGGESGERSSATGLAIFTLIGESTGAFLATRSPSPPDQYLYYPDSVVGMEFGLRGGLRNQ